MDWHRQRAVDVAIRGPLTRTDLAGLTTRLCEAIEASGAVIVVCDVDGAGADAVTVDALAHLQLIARRHGGELRLGRASADLRELIALLGLDDVLSG